MPKIVGYVPPDLSVPETCDGEIDLVRKAVELPGDVGLVKAGLSFKSNFIWMLSGNVVYALCQWGVIVVLAKLGNSSMVGEFSLGLAIATPVLMFSNLQLRAVQATDARHSYEFHEYLRLRLFTTVAALAIIVGIVEGANYQHKTALTLLAVAVIKGIDTVSDIHYGLFQQHDRLNEAGISMILRGILSLMALSAAIYLTHDILWGCVGVTAAWLAALLLFDARRAESILRGSESRITEPRHIIRKETRSKGRVVHRYWGLARLAFPLGIVTTMAAVNLNVPRYFIHAQMGEYQLGIFSAMAYTTVAMTLVSDSLSHSGVPKMSRLYAERRFTEFCGLLLRLVLAGIVLSVAALAVARFAGPRVLAALYGKEYAAQSRVFTLLILAAAINCVASAFTTGITSARRFGIQVPLFGLVITVCVFTCARWVPYAGLFGGALAMVCSALVRLILSLAVIAYILLGISKAGGPPSTARHCMRVETC